VEKLIEYDVMDCMECGTCVYNCPAGRPLVQAIRLGKAMVKAGGKK
jgi:electron transport complex protein RnfC